MATLESILAESFNAEYNKILKKEVKTTELKNVKDIFRNVHYEDECIICYTENIKVIKCFKCSALYCCDCLTKLASNINKCVCGITIKTNYRKFIDYNLKLPKPKESHKQNPKPKEPLKPNENKYIISYDDYDLDNIYDFQYFDNILSGAGLEDYNKFENNYIYDDNEDENKENENTENKENENKENEYINNIVSNKIYNIDFKSYRSSPDLNNFKYKWEHSSKTLTFTPYTKIIIPFKEIIINYIYLDATFQGILYCYLLHIINQPPEVFIKKWNKIAMNIETFLECWVPLKNKEEKRKEQQEKLIDKIIAICE